MIGSRTAGIGSIVAMALGSAVPAVAQQPSPDPSPTVRLAPDPAPVRSSRPPAAVVRTPAHPVVRVPAATATRPATAVEHPSTRTTTTRRGASARRTRSARRTPLAATHRASPVVASPALVAALRRPLPLPRILAAPASPPGDRGLLAAAGGVLLGFAVAGAMILRRAQLEVRT